MGMDVYGREPANETGKYFRRSVWGWRGIACYCEDMAPEVAMYCAFWHSNDGGGLDARLSIELADVLDAHIENGTAAAYVKVRDERLAGIPDEDCQICQGSGVRTDPRGVKAGHPEKPIPAEAKDQDGTGPHPRAGMVGWCNGCDGRGHRHSWERAYRLTVDDLREWSAFVRASGGFNIH